MVLVLEKEQNLYLKGETFQFDVFIGKTGENRIPLGFPSEKSTKIHDHVPLAENATIPGKRR